MEATAVIDKLHALGLHDISGAITRERLALIGALAKSETQNRKLREALEAARAGLSGSLLPSEAIRYADQALKETEEVERG